MSKTVTAVSGAVTLPGGEPVVLCSDGTLRRCNEETIKGEDVSDYPVAIDRKGMSAIRKAMPLLKQAQALKDKLNKMSDVHESEVGSIRFVGDGIGDEDQGEFGVGVGCTFVLADELPEVMKLLGIKK